MFYEIVIICLLNTYSVYILTSFAVVTNVEICAVADVLEASSPVQTVTRLAAYWIC